MYRFVKHESQVMLVHPGGPFWAKKLTGSWSIPKGEFTDEEEPLAAAQREFFEETGLKVSGDFLPLKPVKQKSGKLVYAWALQQDLDVSDIRSNLFEMEWPPHSGQQKAFPEVDRAAWFTLAEARTRIVAGQLPLLDELEQLLSSIP